MTIAGLDNIARRLGQMKGALSQQIMEDALRKGAKVFQKAAVDKAPVSASPHLLKSYASVRFKNFTPRQYGVWITPGNLKKNIRVKLDREGRTKDSVRVVVYITKNAWYGTFQEFGTSRHGKQPFMTPAFESQKGAATDAVLQHLRAVLQSEGIVNR